MHPTLPSEFQLDQQVIYSGVPSRSNPCTVIGVTFMRSGATTYALQLNNDPGGQRWGVNEGELKKMPTEST
jgi:hypothetical protein